MNDRNITVMQAIHTTEDKIIAASNRLMAQALDKMPSHNPSCCFVHSTENVVTLNVHPYKELPTTSLLKDTCFKIVKGLTND